MTVGPVIIVGAGHAGFQLAASLRQDGFAEPIALINDEAHLPYQRPPLSKAYLKGTGGPDSLMFRPEKFYPDQKIDLIADRAVSIDRARARCRSPPARRSTTAISCWRPARAIGCSIFPTPISTACAICARSTKARRCGSCIASGRRVVVIGAGFIGLEFAATARAKGLEVDVVELATRVMARAVTAEISEFFQARHTEAGIRIHLGVQVTSIEADGGKVTGVSLSDGRHIPADLVVVGVGVLPNVELAAAAGLPVASGIIVDEHLSTSDPNISAVGDCALFASPRFGGSLRLGVGAERHRPRPLRRRAADRRRKSL